MPSTDTRIPHVKVAIIDSNVLAAIGLKHILQSVMPMMQIDTFATMAELEGSHPDNYFHFFVNTAIVLQHMPFFTTQCHKTIVLTPSTTDNTQLTGFHCLCTSQNEEQFVKQLLLLEQHAHAHGRNLPPHTVMPDSDGQQPALSQREIEVLSHIAYGKTNKEIADKLCISVTTVVSHRKNIMDKLNIRNLSALTIYAVMHGYVDVNKI